MRRPVALAPAALLAVLSLAARPALAAEQVLTLDPGHAKVTFLLVATGHDVEGSFPLNKCEVRFDPAAGTASGEISLDAAHGVTGNPKRDKTMQEKVLLTPTAPAIVFHPERFEGVLPEAGEGDVTLHGKVSIAGIEQPLSLPAHVTRAGENLHLKSAFPVPFVAWGLKDPSVLFLKVEKSVQLTIEGDAVLAGAAVAPAVATPAAAGQ